MDMAPWQGGSVLPPSLNDASKGLRRTHHPRHHHPRHHHPQPTMATNPLPQLTTSLLPLAPPHPRLEVAMVIMVRSVSVGPTVSASISNLSSPRTSDCESLFEHIRPCVAHRLGSLYNWTPILIPNAKSLGLRSIPMLWGDNQISEFQRLVKSGYADAVAGFNE